MLSTTCWVKPSYYALNYMLGKTLLLCSQPLVYMDMQQHCHTHIEALEVDSVSQDNVYEVVCREKRMKVIK